MCAQRLFASEVDVGDAHLAVGQLVGVLAVLAGLHLGQTPVDPAPLAGQLWAVVTSVALVEAVGEYPEAAVEARTSSFRDLR
jgi:hypothetical protein